MTKDQEKKIDEVLKTFGHRCKINTNGGRVFQNDLKEMVKVARETIKEILVGKE